MPMFEGKKILITGGTGSLGNALTSRLLNYDVDTIRIFSRNENKQFAMESKFNDDRLRFLLGDVRDYPRLVRAMEDIDIVFHAAALKHVPKIEYNPFEAIKTNVMGTQNVIDACLKNDVEKASAIKIALEADRASNKEHFDSVLETSLKKDREDQLNKLNEDRKVWALEKGRLNKQIQTLNQR